MIPVLSTRPLESCLFKKDPDLLEVLGVLVLANKYCATTLEEQARSLAIQLTDPKAIDAHLTAKVSSLRVIELAQTARCDEIASAAWDVAMQEFRECKREIHEMLSFADRLGEPQYVGEAYYEAMLRGHRVWNRDPHLTPAQKQRLGAGAASCVETLNGIVSVWRRAPRHFEASHRCTHHTTVPNSLELRCGYKFSVPWVEECAERGLSHCDLLGRLEVATNVRKPRNYSTFDTKIVRGGEDNDASWSPRMPDCHDSSIQRATQVLVSYRRPPNLAKFFSIGEAASSD